MSIRLFVFDWDGTALGGHEPYDRFPAEFVRFLDGLAERGIVWATNTAWGVDAQYKVITASNVKSRPAFLAGSSGRSIAYVTKNKLKPDAHYERRIQLLDRRFLQRVVPDMQRIAAYLLRNGLADQLYFNPYGHHYMTVNFANKSKAQRGWQLMKPLLKSGAVYRMADAEQSDTLLPAHMNKGAAVAYMQQRLGLKPEETLVAGDGWNDRHMFDVRVARWMVCPANAHAGIKALVRKHNGIISRKRYSWGIVEAAEKLLASSNTPKSNYA